MNTNVNTNLNKHMGLDEGIKIQKIISENRNTDGSLNLSLKDIAAMVGKDPTTVSKELKAHRINSMPRDSVNPETQNKICKHFEECTLIDHISPYGKPAFCKHMNMCYKTCKNFEHKTCKYTARFPWVCNGCPNYKKCHLTKFLYYSDQAQKEYEETLVSSRVGINMSKDEFQMLDHIVTEKVRQGQPIVHICKTNDLGVSQRTVYNFFENGQLTVKRHEARRMVTFKVRKKHKISKQDLKRLKQNRSYSDYCLYSLEHPELNVVQMDTVISSHESLRCLLTLYFINFNFQLAILLPNKEANSVTNAINDICNTLGLELFKDMFGIILTDNGVEFADPLSLEIDPETGEQRTKVFYCEAYKSCEKGACEKNHEYIRYILPKSSSFENLTQEKVSLMMSHINSTVRGSIKCTPYELMELSYGKETLEKLQIKKIDPQDVSLKPSLLKK